MVVHKPSLGSWGVATKKCVPNRFSRFNAYLIQPDRQIRRIYIYKIKLTKGMYICSRNQLIENMKVSLLSTISCYPRLKKYKLKYCFSLDHVKIIFHIFYHPLFFSRSSVVSPSYFRFVPIFYFLLPERNKVLYNSIPYKFTSS